MIDNKRMPAEVFHPGEFIADELEAREWSLEYFSSIMKMPVEQIKNIIEGKVDINQKLAKDLEKSLEVPADFWINAQKNYDKWK